MKYAFVPHKGSLQIRRHMGGGYYDREVESADASTGYSKASREVLSKTTSLHKSLDPKNFSTNKMTCEHKHPIVFALDVTGSMGDWTKIVYDKMPMFYGQIMLQGYLSDPAVSFCAIGDATCDNAPLQIAEFGQGKQIDQLISKIYLEGGGGGGYSESYELAAYFYSKHYEHDNVELPFFFVTGDEKFYDTVNASIIKDVFGKSCQGTQVRAKDIWDDIKTKFNVFHIHKPYYDSSKDVQIKEQWTTAIGKAHVLEINDPRAVIDVVLGAIAITSGARNLQGYIKDMEERGQTKERIAEVTGALKLLDSTYKADNIVRFGGLPPVKMLGEKRDAKKEESKKEAPRKDLFEKIKDSYEQKEKSEMLDEKHQKYKKELRDLKVLFKDKIPEEFSCPITGEIFYDPVMTDDGHSYERNAITSWLEKHDTSPVTNLPLESKRLIPNQTLKKIIREFYESNKK